jgi:hypothetical protein
VSKLGKALGLERPSGPPPKYQPKISIRVACGRSKQIREVSVDIPIEGESYTASANAHEKLDDILERLGILTPRKQNMERENAQRNLQAEEEKQQSA